MTKYYVVNTDYYGNRAFKVIEGDDNVVQVVLNSGSRFIGKSMQGVYFMSYKTFHNRYVACDPTHPSPLIELTESAFCRLYTMALNKFSMNINTTEKSEYGH